MQVIWKMLSHLFQFSVVLVVIMLGFALFFYSLFAECEIGTCENEELLVFDTYLNSLLLMFDAMLGNVDFMVLESRSIDCQVPNWTLDLGLGVLAFYMMLMAVLMLNLLIAVLTTVYSEVYAKREMEYQLVRTKIAFKNATGVAQVM